MTKLFEQGFPFFDLNDAALSRTFTTANNIAQFTSLQTPDLKVYRLEVSGNALHWADGKGECNRNDTLIPAGTVLYVKPETLPPKCSFITANNGQNGTISITEYTD